MKYLNNKLKNRIKLYKKNEQSIYILKWIKKDNKLNYKQKNILIFNLKKKINFNIISITKFFKICNKTWRSKSSISPFFLTKTQIKLHLSKNELNGFKKI